MSESPTLPARVQPRPEYIFPTLTDAQLRRLEAHGRLRAVAAGEILTEPGTPAPALFAVRRGRLDVVRSVDAGEAPVTTHGPGAFTGELSLVTGRPSLVRIRAVEDGEVIRIERDSLLGLLQTDAELSDVLLRAFILRRVRLIAEGFGDAVLVGSSDLPATLRIKEFLTRNGHPFTYLDAAEDESVRELLARLHVDQDAGLVLLICGGTTVLRTPTNAEIAECLGFNQSVDLTRVRDLVILGAGPSGLAAAVYAASEGLDVLVVEPEAPGGQAGTSSKIENYLGFPTGISGQELAARAFTQAQKFGAQLLIASSAGSLECDQTPYAIDVGNGRAVRARAVVVATGAEYRRLACEDLRRFEGAGVYYVASFMEAQLCGVSSVVVVGGGNSAGQASVFLAQTAEHVHLLVRSDGLSKSMSRYLVRRIEGALNVTVHYRCQITAAGGNGHLETVHWKNDATGQTEGGAFRHVFVMTGADPNTAWLHGCVALDPHGFVRTGPDLSAEDLGHWPLVRPPHLLETNLPGVFAVGDVRCRSVKRVASAVGEGAIAVSFVHSTLAEATS